MIAASAAAAHTHLAAALPIAVYDGAVPDNPAVPYVVLWTSAPQRSSDRLSGEQSDGLHRFQTTCVDLTVQGARVVQDAVHAALVDAQLDVPGRASARVKHTSTQVPREETRPARHLWLAVDTWSLASFPTSP